jgi:hypothetical protein
MHYGQGDRQTYPELRESIDQDLKAIAEFRVVSQTLQVMELAWSAMNLDRAHTHPVNRGWMNTFRRWSASPNFQKFWPILRAEFSRPFVRFCEDLLNLSAVEAEVIDVADASKLEIVALDSQFASEWSDVFERLNLPTSAFPRKGFLADAIVNAVRDPKQTPLLWILRQPVSTGNVPCGIACVVDSKRREWIQSDKVFRREAELLLWVEGSYRSMGLGRQFAEEVMLRIRNRLPSLAPEKAFVRLTAWYPFRDRNSARSAELAVVELLLRSGLSARTRTRLRSGIEVHAA